MDYVLRHICAYSQLLSVRGKNILSSPTENGGSGGLASVLEVDVKQIVTMARETYEK